ncbi:MutS2 protein [Ephemerocybe angulata]|uniref:MutS2 protein n=1 Tax=Ephemerocybe angulata TaxID=980116 RepID=A0A8H6MEG3_9AGAR|nr:MutS2 protein [Tulosesus angulatus]
MLPVRRHGLCRQIHTACVRLNNEPPRTKRVKRSVSDLPKAYILPNGQPAAPLGAFLDATNVAKAKKRTRSKISATSGTAPPDKGSDTVEPVAPFIPKTQLAIEIHDNLLRFPHCLLLTRVGQFYESYFDQANEIAHLLNIKLTSRKWNGGRVPMCGFPLLHLDKHLKTLVQHHHRFVAMCEEFPKHSNVGEKEFERRVTRIVTPGTLIDEPFLNTFENNYLLSVYLGSGKYDVGLAWIDVSTGEFFSKGARLDTLKDELARIGPREVVLLPCEQDDPINDVVSLLKEEGIFYSFAPFAAPEKVPPNANPETASILLLSDYLQNNLMENAPSLNPPLHESDSTRMQIDAHTIKSLEIKESAYEGGAKGSLVSVVRRTSTDSGCRLLARRLCCPSTSLTEIEGWQSSVAFFLKRPHLRADLIEKLKEMGDIGRIVQRFILKRGDISDLLSVKKTIDLWEDVIKCLELENKMESRQMSQEWAQADLFRKRMHNLGKLSARINDTVIDTADVQTLGDEDENAASLDSAPASATLEKPGRWTIKHGFSPTLAAFHSGLDELSKQKDELEDRLRVAFDAPSLTLRASPSQGMHVHVGRSRRDSKLLDIDPSFVKMSQSASTKCYFYAPWSELGTKITGATTSLIQAEKEAFETLRGEVVSNASLLRNNAAIIDEMDVSIGFAALAEELKLVQPVLTEEKVYHVVNGRHPSVEMGLLVSGRTFTSNTVEMTPTSNMHIITGPNMAGKSTALRQTALIAILAQVGSFVPADSATIGVIDKLFTRIGAKDDLFRDRSTFMVEMLETADILRRATPRSLVIMDEVGRGTTVKDGLAIAFASIHHLVTQNQSNCLFATHFHELADMIGCSSTWGGKGVFSNVRFYCTDVNEIDDSRFAYSYRLQPGVNRDSHGLKVARLAGLPPSALQVASKTLSWLRDHDRDKKSLPELNDDSSFNSSP